MGLEAKCQGRYGKTASEGRLQHEGGRILFRGAFRLDLPVQDLTSVAAAGDELVVTWGQEKARFTLGAVAAAKWVHKILHPPSLLDKLGIKPGQRVALKGKFDPAFASELATRVQANALRAGTAEYDIVLMLARTTADLDGVAAAAARLTQAGALWLVYPKGEATIQETEVRRAGLAAKLVDNKTCAFSGTLTALRFVRPRALRVQS
jgi:hypothetical protein